MSLLLFSALFLVFVGVNQCAPTKRNMPVVGVLLQESSQATIKHGDTYFQDNYVKYLESGGAKVVPVRVNEPESYYVDLMSKINGVLFPGGGVDILTSGYAKAAQVIYQLAKKYNDAGSYFPLWGTCLGFELLTALQTGKNLLSKCDAEDYMLPLKFSSDYNKSRLLKTADPNVIKILIAENITANFHKKCCTPKTFKSTPELSGFFRMVSTNKDRNGLDFVSMMEAFEYPFYGSQWHPEKNSYDMGYQDHIPHTFESARVAQYFANFFVDEARKSNHEFPSMEEEASTVIENYRPVFLGQPTFHNYYFFNFTQKTVQDDYLRFKSSEESNSL
ncbi:gamma-glutamyl hydrolase-like isoform X3 [Lineus longissimus]|uniref:gamma-glutamyl hydrolase-like isoform X3 n=1 Tax=Lineus longissimus TaxID=88925 RepID=UPI00315D57AA